jgi:uncharacterized protein YcfJ
MCIFSDRALFSFSATAKALATGLVLMSASGTGLAVAQGYPYPESQGEMGRVLSSVPIVQQVAVPRQVCNDEQVLVPGQTSGAGAVMGGIAGGAIGNQVGRGSGRAAATAIGIIGGALLGNGIEGQRPSHTETVRQCGTQTMYENQTVGYNVTYEYANRQYTVQMQNDPGAWVRLQVTPVGMTNRAQSPYGSTTGAMTYPVTPPNVTYSPAVVNRPYIEDHRQRQPYDYRY